MLESEINRALLTKNGLKRLSKDEMKRLVESLMEKRRKLNPESPDTLYCLALGAVAADYENILFKHPANYLVENLPPLIVEQLCLKMVEILNCAAKKMQKWDHHCGDGQRWIPFFEFLVFNPYVTEFDCNAATENFPYFSAYRPAYCLMMLLKDKYPHLKKITMRGFDHDPSIQEMPILEMSSKFKNLSCIYMKGYTCNDEGLQVMSENLPKIEELEFNVTKKTLTMAGVVHLSKMQYLKKINMNVKGKTEDDMVPQEILVHAAGKIPNLHTFIFNCEGKGKLSDLFVKLYGQLYPNKNLLVSILWLTADFDLDWPRCLSVMKLGLIGALSDNLRKRIFSLPFMVNNICLIDMLPSEVYEIVETLGQQIKRLEFWQYDIKKFDVKELNGFNFYRVLAACPFLTSINLASISILQADWSSSNDHCITPQHFQKFERFELASSIDEYEQSEELSKIYQMFLIGSEDYDRKLKFPSIFETDILLRVLKENPNALDKLEEINLHCDVDENAFDDDGEIRNVFLDLETIYRHLVFRSPYFKRLQVYTEHESAYPSNIVKKRSFFRDFVKELGVPFILDDMLGRYEISCMRDAYFYS